VQYVLFSAQRTWATRILEGALKIAGRENPGVDAMKKSRPVIFRSEIAGVENCRSILVQVKANSGTAVVNTGHVTF